MLRTLLTTLMPDLAARIEAESREWMLTCPKCGHQTSVWEAGGMRYGARGDQLRLMRCFGCGRSIWHRMTRRSRAARG